MKKYIIISILFIVFIFSSFYFFNMYIENKINLKYEKQKKQLKEQILLISNQIDSIDKQINYITQKKVYIKYQISKDYQNINNINSKIDSLRLEIEKINGEFNE